MPVLHARSASGQVGARLRMSRLSLVSMLGGRFEAWAIVERDRRGRGRGFIMGMRVVVVGCCCGLMVVCDEWEWKEGAIAL